MSTFSLYSKRFVGWMVTMFLLVLTIHLSRSAWGLWQMRGRVTDVEAEVRVLAQKKDELEKKVAEQATPFAIEKEIRDKLQMAKPGETVVIIPEERIQALGATISAQITPESAVEADVPNWQRWWDILCQRQDSNL